MTNGPLTSNEKLCVVLFWILSIPLLASGVAVVPTLLIFYAIYMMKKDNDFSNIESVVKFTEITLILAFGVCAIAWFNLSIGGGYPEAFPIYTIMVGVYFLLYHFLFYVPLKAHSKWVESNHIFSNKPVVSIAEKVTSQVQLNDTRRPVDSSSDNARRGSARDGIQGRDHTPGKIWQHKGYEIKKINSELGIVGIDTGEEVFQFVSDVKEYIDQSLPDRNYTVTTVRAVDDGASRPNKAKQDGVHAQEAVVDELLKWAKLKEDGHISEEEFQEARDKLLKKH